MTPEIVRQLAPHGTLRAALNLSNFLLVSGKDPHLRQYGCFHFQ